MTDTHSLLHTSIAFLPSLDISSGGLTSGVSGGSVYLGAGQATGVGSVGGSIEKLREEVHLQVALFPFNLVLAETQVEMLLLHHQIQPFWILHQEMS